LLFRVRDVLYLKPKKKREEGPKVKERKVTKTPVIKEINRNSFLSWWM